MEKATGNVFGETVNYSLEEAKKVIQSKIDPKAIKTRQQGKATLSYIGGHTVIRLLNKAFNYQWTFEVVKEEVVQSLPKFNKFAKKGEPTHEAQPPVAKVLGRLTVPGLGFKEQYGSKILIGGATEQESAFKSASTDALKKCASLFGIGLELYGDDDWLDDLIEQEMKEVQSAPQEQVKEPATQPVQEPVATEPVQEQKKETVAQPQTTQQPVQEASNMPNDPNQWQQVDIDRLKELKQILGITENPQLDPYVREFLDHPDMTFYDILPVNIKAFNIFLAKKAENL